MARHSVCFLTDGAHNQRRSYSPKRLWRQPLLSTVLQHLTTSWSFVLAQRPSSGWLLANTSTKRKVVLSLINLCCHSSQNYNSFFWLVFIHPIKNGIQGHIRVTNELGVLHEGWPRKKWANQSTCQLGIPAEKQEVIATLLSWWVLNVEANGYVELKRLDSREQARTSIENNRGQAI